MRLLAIENEADAGIGVFAEPVTARGWELETWRPADDPDPPPLDRFAGIVPLGGAINVGQVDEHPWIEAEIAFLASALDAGSPLLGVCLGSQMLAAAAGSTPVRASRPEIGWFDVELTDAGRADPLLSAMPTRFEAFQWHSYEAPLPPAGLALARSPVCLQAYRVGTSAWGIQFHAEVELRSALDWTADHNTDPDFVRIGLDPDTLVSQIHDRAPAWNQLGVALCDRFCEIVAGAASQRVVSRRSDARP